MFLKNDQPGFTELFFTSSSSDTTVAALRDNDNSSVIVINPTTNKHNHSPPEMTLKLFWSGQFDTKSVAAALGMTKVKLSPGVMHRSCGADLGFQSRGVYMLVYVGGAETTRRSYI